MKTRKVTIWFYADLLAFAVSACSVLLSPFALADDGNLNALGYAAGGLFWLGMIAGIAGYILLYRQMKDEVSGDTQKRKLPPGLRFGSNPAALAADVIFVIACMGTIYCAVKITVNEAVAIGCLLLALAGIYAHFLLNGKIYQYIWNHRTKENHSRKRLEGED